MARNRNPPALNKARAATQCHPVDVDWFENDVSQGFPFPLRVAEKKARAEECSGDWIERERRVDK